MQLGSGWVFWNLPEDHRKSVQPHGGICSFTITGILSQELSKQNSNKVLASERTFKLPTDIHKSSQEIQKCLYLLERHDLDSTEVTQTLSNLL